MAAWMLPAAIIGSSLFGADAASSAADTQAAAADRSGALQRETAKEQLALQTRMYEENVGRQKPFYTAGVNALPELVQASRYTPFSMKTFQQDPGYAFRLKEGQQALDRSAAARGGLISGAALKAAQRYGQEMGSQEYMNAFNRYQTERAARLQPLQSLTGMSQTTANTLGTAGQNYAGSSANIAGNMAANVGEAYQGAANARASGYVGGANALTSGLGTYLNYRQGNNMLDVFRGGGGGYGAPAGYGTVVPGDYSSMQG
jgi:hypothetical protein